MNEQHNPWTVISQKKIYDNPWISVTEYDVINPGGGKGIYGKVHFKNIAIGIIPLDEENNTWLVGQYRFPTDKYSWELPEGGGSTKESGLVAAQRELLEETGLKAERWDEILDMHLSNSVTDEVAIVYVARGLSQHEADPEETEQLVVQKMAFATVLEKVIAGEITDAITVAAVLKLDYLIQHKLI
jgi:8-oxo-dGTP pyrophosphatase MutT (NUDIX family)